MGLLTAIRPLSTGSGMRPAAGVSAWTTAAGASAGTAGATLWAFDAGVGAFPPLRTRTLRSPSSSSNSAMSRSSRSWRSCLSSSRFKTSQCREPLEDCQTSLELPLQRYSGHAQREARTSHDYVRLQRCEQEVLRRDRHEQRCHPLGVHGQLAELAEPGIGRGAEACTEQGGVLSRDRLHVRVRLDDELLDGDAVGAHDHQHLALRHPAGDVPERLAETRHLLVPPLTAASIPSSCSIVRRIAARLPSRGWLRGSAPERCRSSAMSSVRRALARSLAGSRSITWRYMSMAFAVWPWLK